MQSHVIGKQSMEHFALFAFLCSLLSLHFFVQKAISINMHVFRLLPSATNTGGHRWSQMVTDGHNWRPVVTSTVKESSPNAHFVSNKVYLYRVILLTQREVKLRIKTIRTVTLPEPCHEKTCLRDFAAR